MGCAPGIVSSTTTFWSREDDASWSWHRTRRRSEWPRRHGMEKSGHYKVNGHFRNPNIYIYIIFLYTNTYIIYIYMLYIYVIYIYMLYIYIWCQWPFQEPRLEVPSTHRRPMCLGYGLCQAIPENLASILSWKFHWRDPRRNYKLI